MKIVSSSQDILQESRQWRQDGQTIGLVPTMGCLHEGHLSLMRRAKELAAKVIVTIFVNPMQFGPGEDLDAYPRQLAKDCQLAEQQGVDIVFSPPAEAMYTPLFQTMVRVKKLSLGMCGADRPGHFDGVATVVTKLFNTTAPDIAVFGEKDFQQLALIRRMTEDLNFPVEIIGAPIVREADGLAMSSRNKYLLGEDRETALCLSRALAGAREMVRTAQDTISSDTVLAQVKRVISDASAALEYAVVVNAESLQPDQWVTRDSLLAVAAKIGGKVRLIDNTMLII